MLMRLLTLLSVSLLVAPLMATADPVTYTATYKVNLDNKLNGSATGTLSRKGNRYHYELRATALMANSVEQTDFLMDKGQIVSLNYRNDRQVFFRKRGNSLDFDWKRNTVHAVRNGKDNNYAVPPGTLDPLNMEMQIREDLMTTGKIDRDYPLADPKEFHPVRFEINGTEVLNTPMGPIETLKVRRIHGSPDRSTQFWLARSMEYLPVKVVQTDDGAVYKLDLTGYKPAGPVRTSPPVVSAASPAASLPATKPPSKP